MTFIDDFIDVLNIFIDEQIFFLPQVKRSLNISNKYGIYEMPHELPNNLRLKDLRKYQDNPKIS